MYRTYSKLLINIFLTLLLLLGAFLMLRITIQYIPYHTDVAFLRIKQQYIHIDVWRVAFFVHVYTSMLVLLAGFTQFSNYVLKHLPVLHKVVGYIYVVNVLFITGPSGMIMAFWANGGWIGRLGFLVLSTLWIYTTFMAIYYAYKKQIVQHRNFMIRSFALTVSALTLRAWKLGIYYIVELPPMDVYKTVAWLGFVPNIIWAEWFIRRKTKKK
jgi:hypothetical protein